MARVRDFVYLDIERIRSLVSQLDEGIVETFSKSLGSSSSARGSVKGGLFGIASGDAGVEQLWKRDSHESRSLHDYIFSRLEELLLAEGLVKEIESSSDELISQSVKQSMSPTDFLLIEANVELNDLARMNSLIKKFNEIGKFFIWNSLQQAAVRPVTDADLTKAMRDPGNNLTLDRNLQAGLSIVIENLIGEQILLRSMPFHEVNGPSFVGVLDPACLREKMQTILTKFGTRPAEKWKVFCQVASLEPHGASPSSPASGEEGIGMALRKMSDAMRELDRVSIPYGPLDTTITPIAVYREFRSGV